LAGQVKIAHVITGLNTGGAETMLYKLLSGMDRGTFEARVVSLTDVGPVGEKIRALGVPVRALGMRRGVPDPRGVWQLTRWLKEDKPNLVQTWMYHADLVGGLAARLAGNIPVVWGVRHSNLDPGGNKRTTIWTAKACARLSHRLPIRIVCCSETSRAVHTELGYAHKKMVVIPNGFDLTAFKPDPAARESVRQELGISKDALLIGLVGRFDPQKDHRNFVAAAARLSAAYPEVHFPLCGDGATWDNAELAGWIEAAGIRQRFHLLGRREDMPRLTAALDIASSSSSYGEGFPNIIGEAMACGVPCVVTDVGDSAFIVGDTGLVVPPRDPDALATAWRKLIELGPEGRRRLGAVARRRVEERFSLPTVVSQYQKLYRGVIRETRERH
jgi:glycosyltransferase involved in cell wall biosynthesis